MISKEKRLENKFTHWIKHRMTATTMPGPYEYRIYSMTLGTHQQVEHWLTVDCM
jgi:hypothetical protein